MSDVKRTGKLLLSDEIRNEINAATLAGSELNAKELAQSIIDKHYQIEGADASIYVECTFDWCRDTARKILGGSIFKPGETPQQLIMPGFEHLQKMYPIDREEESMLVPINDLTDDEIKAKIVYYENMAIGCREHAAELRRYLNLRHEKAS